MKSYGRAPTFLLATGYEQARSVVAMLAGDVAAAERVELVLPETGVCSTRPLCRRWRLLRRSCTRRSECLLRRRCGREGGRKERLRLRHDASRRCFRSEVRSKSVMPPRAIWAIGCGQLVNWGVLFFAFSVLLVPVAGRVRCAAMAGRRRIFARAPGLRDRGARGRAARRSRTGAGCDAGRWPARSRAPDPVGAAADDLDDLYRVGRARPVHGLDPLRAGLRHRRPRLRGSGRTPARDRDRHGDRRTREHRVSSRDVGARHALRLARRRRGARDHHRGRRR